METTSEAAFPGYVVQSNKTGPAFYIFVLVYTAFAFFLIAPLVSWSRSYEKKRLGLERGDLENPEDKESPHDGQHQRETSPQTSTQRTPTSSQSEVQGSSNNAKHRPRSSKSGSVISGTSSHGFGMLLRELDKVAAAEYPDRNPDFRSQISGSIPQPAGAQTVVSSKAPTEQSSGVLSAATTSRLHAPTSKKLSGLILDVGGRRWKHRRPIGRVDVIQHAINSESGSAVRKGAFTVAVTNRSKRSVATGMSDVASSVLEEQGHDVNPAFFARTSLRRQHFHRAGSVSAKSDARSAMSSIVDDITPNDAADANDPGRGNLFIQGSSRTLQHNQGFGVDSTLKLGCFSSMLEGLLELAAPGEEKRRVVRSSFPLSIGAMSESLFRLITACFISQYLGSESMIAYLLVGLFVRLTSEELSGAIIDALSGFVQASLFSREGDVAFLAGQYVQLAVVLQLLLGIPLLLVWAFTMESVVYWLVQSSSIAFIAEEYARVVVFNFLIHAVSRTFTVVFHICGHEHFESVIDISASTLQLITIACVVALVDDASLATVGYIQLLIGIGSAVAKVMFPVMRGWMQPFRSGIFQNFALIQNRSAFWQLLRATLPLFVGTVLEFGEWEVLTIFLRHLGPAEVATWALLGAFWDVLEALTEGIGEAAATQVAFLLAAAQPERAKRLSHAVIYLAVVQSFFVTSALYMSGKYLAVLFSTDPTIQHMTNNSIALIGLANITMAFSQVSWSLIGAQGRFRLATSVVFFSRWIVTMPIALISIFAFFLDLNSVSGALVVGYATASCALTFIVLRSDWERLALVMKEMNDPIDIDELDYLEDFDDEDDDSSEYNESDDDSDREEASAQPTKVRRSISKASKASSRSNGLRHRSHESG